MARFYVGQRVRIVRCTHQRTAHHVGKEGVIIGRSESRPDSFYVDSALMNPCGRRVVWAPDKLEPLISPHEACDDAEFIASLDKLAQRVGEVT